MTGAARLMPVFGLVVLFAAVMPAAAQEIKWRYEYNSARREAEEKGRPLVIDFYTDQCPHCVRLDLETFREPAVAAAMNDKFIPLKINASRDPRLTSDLQISRFPTVVLAAADGKILGTLEGFMEASRFQDYLQRALAGANNTDWMQRDYQEASKAIAASEYPRAVALLKGIVKEGKGPVQQKADQLLKDLEAEGRLAVRRKPEDKSAPAVENKLTTVLKGPVEPPADRSSVESAPPRADVKPSQRRGRAKELLDRARQDFKNKQYPRCFDDIEELISNYGSEPEGIEASQMANEIRNHPEWMKPVCETLSERLGNLLLAQAEGWLRKGDPQQAEACLERVMQMFPDSRQADTARIQLLYLKGQPNVPADFRKP